MNADSSDSDKLRILKINFIYCIVIFVLTLIAVATDRWSSQQRFTEYLSNAATMTSLVLALVAIFYSFIANNSLSKSLGSIGTVAGDVRESQNQISQYLELARDSGASAKESAALIRGVSSEVSSNLESLRSTLTAIKGQTESLNDAMAGLPVRFDQLETKVIDALGEKKPQTTAVPRSEGSSIDSASIKRFLATASVASNLLTYACVLAEQTGKELSLASFCEAIASKLEGYLSGFVACMDAIQIIDRSFVDGKPRVYKIMSVHPTLKAETKSYIEGFLNRAYKDKPAALKDWLEKLRNVEAMFA